ncbi:unnamed protein product [Lasius platythorax]|uniref:RNA-directed DNA polymerase n=1 Tax=Lasius platythorax TaxID=488582 RepID=A0AAV2MXI9_9HYME
MFSRSHLDSFTLPKLHEELRQFGVTDPPLDHPACVDMIISLFERKVPRKNTLIHQTLEAEGMPDSPVSAVQPPSEVSNIPTNQSFAQSFQKPSDDTLSNLCTLLASHIQQQNQQVKLQQEQAFQQQEMLTKMLTVLSINSASVQSRNQTDFQTPTTMEQNFNSASRSQVPENFSMFSSSASKFLSSQIPQFGGTDKEDVEIWIEKLECVARLHGFSQEVMLSAAFSRLVKTARRWFDYSTGSINSSWIIFRSAIINRFRRKILFGVVLQEVEARKWLYYKESFADYAMDKIALMQPLKLSDEDSIHFLVNGISSLAIRGLAASLRVNSLDEFLREMQHITTSCNFQHKSSSPVLPRKDKFKNDNSSPEDASHFKKKDLFCAYCRGKNHTKDDCFKLKNKKRDSESSQTNNHSTVSAVAAVDVPADNSEDTIAYVNPPINKKFIVNSTSMQITQINGISCNLIALLDTGSPVSFISSNIFSQFFGSLSLVKDNNLAFNAVNGTPIRIYGSVTTPIKLEILSNFVPNVTFLVMESNFNPSRLILGRDFLSEHKIIVTIDVTNKDIKNKVQLFSEVAFTDVIDCSSDELDNLLSDINIDFDNSIKNQLTSVIKEVYNANISPIEDNYAVKVNLKDESVFAYSPRRFAYKEKLQIREIIDDLLSRNIIRESNSPYCSRIVPVRKKNGSLRLCIDLRPLNIRTVKQKYPFPIIEDCLTRLSDKSIFTLLDLKDGFHQISIHPDHTKYFAFATPDGQYEYLRLPFGICEAPAEFQKRLIMILQSLIRNDKIIVYIDDILIPSSSIEDNLNTLRQVLVELRRYDFQLNFKKCLFLKTTIEYLGYIISPSGITLSFRHTEAVKNFPQPSKIVDLQRFLGLTNYFRKFIKDYAIITKPLNMLLRKSTKFKFSDECIQAFNKLKEKLTSSPVLKIYNPHLETEVHTDASALAIAGILLQKQNNGLWAPVTFYSQNTNKAEINYHSFELEMLAIVKSIERFHVYLYGLDFTIVTDCHALVFAVNKANINPRIARWILKLQNYRFKISHRDGRRMMHVDALSRVINFVESMPLEKELQFRQLQDPKLKDLSQKLEFKEDDKFELIDGLVFKKGTEKSRFVVPEAMISNIIRYYHDNMAHCGLEKTIKGIMVNYWFPSLKKRVHNYIDNCVICLLANSSVNSREGELQITDSPTYPFHIFHADHFGPIKETRDGFKHIFLVIDAFTRYTWLFPTKSTGSREAIKNLSFLFQNFGFPRFFVSDRGTAFTSQDFENFLKHYNVSHRLVAVAAPWANGLIERVNRFLKSSLKKVVEDDQCWNSYLDTVQYVINNTYHSSVRATPSKLLFGIEMHKHPDAELVRFLDNIAKNDFDIQEDREAARKLAIESTNKVKEYNKLYYDERHKKPSLYNTGDYVLIRDSVLKPGENKKLKPVYKGPYLVSKVLNKNRYVIQDIPGFNHTAKPYNSILSPDRIKPWVKSVVTPM